MKLTRDPNNRHGNLSPLYKIQICSLLNKEIKHIKMLIMKIQRIFQLIVKMMIPKEKETLSYHIEVLLCSFGL